LIARRYVVFAELPILKRAPLAAAVASRSELLSPAALAVAPIERKPVPMRPKHPGKYLESILLRVIEALIKRSACVGDALKRGARFGHPVGTSLKPIERACRRGGGTSSVIGVLARLPPFDAQLRQIAQRLFEYRPIFSLIGIQLEACS
jgi:hypothetical protein